MQAFAHTVHAEQHHAQEAGFEEEGGQHLVGHQRADDRAGLVGEHRPVGAELVGHDDARDHAHGEHQREDLDPVAEQVHVVGAPGLQPQAFEHRQVAGQADRDGGKQEVKAHRERKLDARQQKCVGQVEHQGNPCIGEVADPLH